LVGTALLAASFSARADDPPPPLRRGVNLSNWFTDSGRQPLGERDFQQIKAAGFDHVRLPVDPELLGFSLSDASSGRVLFDFTKIDDAINVARGNGLAVIFDLQPTAAFVGFMERDPRAEAGFIGLWKHIAEHYKAGGAGKLAFEILDAPRRDADPMQYRSLVLETVAAIHGVSPNAIVIVDLPKDGGLDAFDGFTPLDDRNVYYGFRFFEPFLFTRQGRKESGYGMPLRYFRNLPYPSHLADPAVAYAPNAADAIEAKKALQDYIAASWDIARVAHRIKVAADWAKASGRRVICVAFGVTRDGAPAASRYQWIADVRTALEADDISWDLWDYTDLFGIAKLTGETVSDPRDGSVRLADPREGARDIEPEAVKALFAN
jgi:endoglucanase